MGCLFCLRVEERTGWILSKHLVVERVHARLFISQNVQCEHELSIQHQT